MDGEPEALAMGAEEIEAAPGRLLDKIKRLC
jgi:hypothetical protein